MRKPRPCSSKNDQNVEPGDNHAGEKRQTEQQLKRDSRAENFRQIAGGDGDFADNPKRDRSAARIMFAASLGQIAAGGDAELGRKPCRNIAIRLLIRMTLRSV